MVSKIPLAALAGVLLATAIRMVEVGSLKAMAKATRSDALILVLTALATLALDLVYAVIIGLVVAGGLALRAVAKQARFDQVPLDRATTAWRSTRCWPSTSSPIASTDRCSSPPHTASCWS